MPCAQIVRLRSKGRQVSKPCPCRGLSDKRPCSKQKLSLARCQRPRPLQFPLGCFPPPPLSFGRNNNVERRKLRTLPPIRSHNRIAKRQERRRLQYIVPYY